ncbi:hypothetical protein OIU74_021023 [Salix koriyanagi]|uniref:Uncharacterized protein n=1 Tax=Salix koriyanagi TaxID=2511006 RepID=A0A9Q0P795_9ROSI|nr:hypothetical protein OIU74_021023 [Salix koriyanagi]
MSFAGSSPRQLTYAITLFLIKHAPLVLKNPTPYIILSKYFSKINTMISYLLEYISIDVSTAMLATLSAAIFSIMFWLGWSSFTRSMERGSSLPPGPRGFPLIGNLASLEPDIHSYFAKLAHTHGPIFKLRLGCKLGIVVSSPSLAAEVLRDHDINFANRDIPDVSRAMDYGRSNIVATPYGPEWRMLKKVCVVKMLSTTTLDSLYPLRSREVRNTVEYIYSRAGSPINVGDQLFLTVFNVVTSMLWGGTVQGKDRASLGAEFRGVVAEMTELLSKPNVSDFFPSLARFDLQGVVKKMRGLAMKFEQIFEKMIDKRLEADGKGRDGARSGSMECEDFLGFLLKLKDEGDPKTPLTMTHVKALLMVCFSTKT